jgi:ABC-type phosphate transport system permease subunit
MALASASTERTVLAGLQQRRADLKGLVFQGLLMATLLVVLLVLFVLLSDVVRESTAVLGERPGGFLTGAVNFTNPAENGIRQGIVGSVVIGLIVMVTAIPLGVAAAIYLEEYARPTRFTRFVDVNIRNLAGVPSIVYGILGFTIFVKALDGMTGGRSLLAGALTRCGKRASASAPPAGRWSVTTCCPTRCRASSPGRCSRSPVPSAKRRRSSSSGRRPGSSRTPPASSNASAVDSPPCR